MNKKSIKILHLIIILISYAEPFWLSWKLVAVLMVLYWLQIAIFKSCVLSIWEYNDNETSFIATNVNKLLSLFGLHISPAKIRFFVNWLILPIVLLVALILQVGLHFVPVVNI